MKTKSHTGVLALFIQVRSDQRVIARVGRIGTLKYRDRLKGVRIAETTTGFESCSAAISHKEPCGIDPRVCGIASLDALSGDPRFLVPQKHRFHERRRGQSHRRDHNQDCQEQKAPTWLAATMGLDAMLRWFHGFHNPKELIPFEEVPPEVALAGLANRAAPGIRMFMEYNWIPYCCIIELLSDERDIPGDIGLVRAADSRCIAIVTFTTLGRPIVLESHCVCQPWGPK